MDHPQHSPFMDLSKGFPCNFCHLVLSTKATRRTHRQTEHTPCARCHKYFANAGVLFNHRRASRHCYCSTCDLHFTSTEAHNDHARHISSKCGHLTVVCKNCKRRYPNDDVMDSHCCLCDRILGSPEGLQKHLASKHKIYGSERMRLSTDRTEQEGTNRTEQDDSEDDEREGSSGEEQMARVLRTLRDKGYSALVKGTTSEVKLSSASGALKPGHARAKPSVGDVKPGEAGDASTKDTLTADIATPRRRRASSPDSDGVIMTPAKDIAAYFKRMRTPRGKRAPADVTEESDSDGGAPLRRVDDSDNMDDKDDTYSSEDSPA